MCNLIKFAFVLQIKTDSPGSCLVASISKARSLTTISTQMSLNQQDLEFDIVKLEKN